MGIIIALISGMLMSIQGVFNTGITKATGNWVCNCFVQFSALIAGLSVWLFFDRRSFMLLKDVTPKFFLVSGIIGTGITYTVIKSMEMLGPAKAAMVIVVSQIFVAYIIEIFGLFGVEKTGYQIKNLAGILMAVAGIIIFKNK